ncbi:hypothetical protein FKZ61_003970 [Litorilinea aerophila]|uniref:Uncharacterized protein n=1 Tax=Litorilinea aerophila TaxID=1204385 RepID=A0A540VKA9_9CHLR|nr:hypothetical protein [Litorilinea aerophila]MCC9075269.1 hypothetical protein [Litorilinea aerophila]OUC09415.1 hypothetical protein RY27_02985 [Litorilinea aerophila]GIV78411.1 MAG: hypothetical protein KatS3mg050_2805 [Litorilinea sp.]GIV80459.1 MAG: hypothetical protein KatS3mg050_4853 [Litorilinea sp.]
MTNNIISPFGRPDPNLPIREGAPALTRPTKEEIAAFPEEAAALLRKNWEAQSALLEAGQFNLDWVEGRHFLLAGATGPGLGGAFASAILGTGKAASVTIIGRDLTRSLNYETGKAMQAQAEAAGMGNRFHWLNDGMALEGPPLAALLQALKEAGADRVVYFNTVAAAISGLLPGMPPVYVKDVDENGLFQWKLRPLTEKEIEITRFVMGEMAVRFPSVLEENGIAVEASVFADWRGSLDKISRDPTQREYGRQGAYSTSLYIPKEFLQEATRSAIGTDRVVLDIFYPMMRTRALPLIPGGVTTANVNQKLMQIEGIRHIDVPELALMGLDFVGRALTEGYDNPFPRADRHDAHLDEWMFEVMARLNNDENSDFYYKRWTELDE